jgi:hypothetical protein
LESQETTQENLPQTYINFKFIDVNFIVRLHALFMQPYLDINILRYTLKETRNSVVLLPSKVNIYRNNILCMFIHVHVIFLLQL